MLCLGCNKKVAGVLYEYLFKLNMEIRKLASTDRVSKLSNTNMGFSEHLLGIGVVTAVIPRYIGPGPRPG